MHDAHLQLLIIMASTRSGRFGPIVTHWFAAQARRRDDMAVDVLDLADAQLPDRLAPEAPAAVAAVSARLAAADGFVIVTPEYNHSFPAPLKTLIDWHTHEWFAKPVGFVSYGGLAGGLRAVEHLRQVFAELHAVTVRDTVSFHIARAQFDPAGMPKEQHAPARSAQVMLDQLAWWAGPLRDARARRPQDVAGQPASAQGSR